MTQLVDGNVYVRSLIEAVTERGWRLVEVDMTRGIVIEEPLSGGLKLTIEGLTLSAEFIRSLPEARTSSKPLEFYATSAK